jgi:hypothetical protein
LETIHISKGRAPAHREDWLFSHFGSSFWSRAKGKLKRQCVPEFSMMAFDYTQS